MWQNRQRSQQRIDPYRNQQHNQSATNYHYPKSTYSTQHTSRLHKHKHGNAEQTSLYYKQTQIQPTHHHPKTHQTRPNAISPPTAEASAADKLQERQRQRYQIRHLESIVRDLSDMPAQDNATTPVTNVPPKTPTTPARLVLPTSESRTRPREDTADTQVPKKKPRKRISKGQQYKKRRTATRHRGP